MTDLQLASHHYHVTFNSIVSVTVGEHEANVLGKLSRCMVLATVKLTLYTHTHTHMNTIGRNTQ